MVNIIFVSNCSLEHFTISRDSISISIHAKFEIYNARVNRFRISSIFRL